MVLDEAMLDLRNLELLAQYAKDGGLRGVDLHIVAACLVQDAAVHAELLVAREQVPCIKRFTDPRRLAQDKVAESS